MSIILCAIARIIAQIHSRNPSNNLVCDIVYLLHDYELHSEMNINLRP